MQQFRGGLVFEADRLCVSPNSRPAISKEEEVGVLELRVLCFVFRVSWFGIRDSGFGMRDPGFGILGSDFRIQFSRFRTIGLVSRVWSSAELPVIQPYRSLHPGPLQSPVSGLEFRAWGSGFILHGLG